MPNLFYPRRHAHQIVTPLLPKLLIRTHYSDLQQLNRDYIQKLTKSAPYFDTEDISRLVITFN